MPRRNNPVAPLELLESRLFLSAAVIGSWNHSSAASTPAATGPFTIHSHHHHHHHHHTHTGESSALPGTTQMLDPGLTLDPTAAATPSDTSAANDTTTSPPPATQPSAEALSGADQVAAFAIVPAVTTPLSAPAVSFVSSSQTTVVLSATPATGGSGNYSYQWYRGTSAGFTPSAATLLPGATSLSLSDSANLAPGTPYFYILSASDGISSVLSNQVIGALTIPTTPISLTYQGGPAMLAYIGSSTWAINQGSGQVPTLIDQDLRGDFPNANFTTFNGAVSGSTTSNFLPGTSLNNTVKAAVQAFSGYKVLRLMIGSNDAANNVPPSTWLSNMQTIIKDALTWPVNKIIVEEIGLREDGGNATLDLIRQYNAARASLVGPNVVLGTADTFENESTHLSTLSSDNIHQNNAGQILLAADQATEVANLFTPQPAIVANTLATDTTGGIITTVLTGAAFPCSSGSSGFTLAGTSATVAWWSVSGTTLKLFLSHAIQPGQSVTLSVAAGAIHDSGGDPLPAISSLPVQNDVNVEVIPSPTPIAGF